MQEIENQSIPISIAIPACGRADLLKLTLESLAAQTYKNFEVVVSDDSPKEEDRAEIKNTLDEFAQKTDIKCKYIFTQAALYQASNTNQAIHNTTYNYVHLLHSDDILAPECIQTEVKLINEYSEAEFIYNDETRFHDEFKPNIPKAYSYIDPFSYFKKHIHSHPPLPSGWFFKKELFFKLGGFESKYKYLCDLEFFYKVLKYCIKNNKFLIRIKKGHMGWRQHKNTVSNKLWITYQKEQIPLAKKIYEIELKDKYVDGVFLCNFFFKFKKNHFMMLCNDFTSKLPYSFLNFPEVIKVIHEQDVFYNKIEKIKKQRKYDKLFNHKIFKILGKTNNKLSRLKLPLSNFPKEEYTLTLEINPSYTNSGSDFDEICINYNNTLNLDLYKNIIKKYKNLRIININTNRFYLKTLNEILKVIQKGQFIEFSFCDNEFLTKDEFIILINRLYNHRLRQTESNHNNNINLNLITFECISNPDNHYLEPFTGYSFGIIGEKCAQKIKQFIQSIEEVSQDKPYEILMLNSALAEEFKDYKNVKILEDTNSMNSSQKKNFICEKAVFSDIILSNGEFILNDSIKNYRYNYAVATPKLVNPNNERVLDWVLEENNELKPINYREYSSFTSLNPYIVLIRKKFFENNKWDETVDDITNIDFSKRLRQNGVIIELIDFELTYTGGKLKPISEELIYNSEYEINNGRYICGQKIYKIENDSITSMELNQT